MSTGIQKRLPGLYRLFAAYVNQDFDVHGGTVDDAIARFVDESKATDVTKARRELDALLAMKLPDARLSRTLDALRCGFDWAKAGGATAFLVAVRARLDAPSA